MPTNLRKKIVRKSIDTGMKLTITAELTPDEDEGGFTVFCPELDIYTQGENVDECVRNLQEAATGYIKVVGIDNLKFRQKPVLSSKLKSLGVKPKDKVTFRIVDGNRVELLPPAMTFESAFGSVKPLKRPASLKHLRDTAIEEHVRKSAGKRK